MKALLSSVLAVVVMLISTPDARGEARPGYPTPNAYPIAWELDFEYGTPRRIVVDLPDRRVPQAFWYLTYTVTNNTDREQTFLPKFELLTGEGKLIRSDRNIPPSVFEAIKAREGNRFLEPFLQIAGVIRVGEPQARDGVAIWPEPEGNMKNFSIFVSGLSGEATTVTAGEQELILRKTLHLSYRIRGETIRATDQHIVKEGEEWIMR